MMPPRSTAALDGEQFAGRGLFVSFDRNARHWNFDLAYQEYSPTFRTANGFVTGNDVRGVRMWKGVMFYPENAWIERVQPGIFGRTEYDFRGEKRKDFAEAMLWSRLRGQTQVFMSYGIGRERFRDVLFEGLTDWNLNVNSRFSDVLTVGFYMGGGRSIYRGDEPERGMRRTASVWATIKPLQGFVIQPEVDYSALHDLDTDETFFSGYIVRTRFSFQFTRELSLRLVTQYNDFNEAFDVEPLVQYEINPFTVFYIGSTHDMNRFEQPVGWTQSQRQFFFGVSVSIPRRIGFRAAREG
jgi:hypothetical protein